MRDQEKGIFCATRNTVTTEDFDVADCEVADCDVDTIDHCSRWGKTNSDFVAERPLWAREVGGWSRVEYLFADPLSGETKDVHICGYINVCRCKGSGEASESQ